MKGAKSVEEYIIGQKKWKEGLIILREIARSTELVETVKWGSPVYTINGKNVIGIGGFKDYCGIWFFQGAFLRDDQKKLINAQEGKTKGLRQWRFTSIDEIDQKLVLDYIQEAIQNQKAGKEIIAETKQLKITKEFNKVLASNAVLKASFESLTSGKQREYAEFIAEAKRVETKLKRIEKIIPMITAGIGLNDKYR